MLKRYLTFISFFIIFSFSGYSQYWAEKKLDRHLQTKELSFFEIQTDFDNYCSEKQIHNGKYWVDGRETKMPGWKRFKRWEWFWESRVDPITGLLPPDALDNIYQVNQQKASLSTVNLGDWKALGPKSSPGGYAGVGRINCIAFNPVDNFSYWVGSPSGGLWHTKNDGVSWQVLSDSNAVLGVSEIIIPSDYESSQTIYIATGDRDGGSLWVVGGGMSSDNPSVGVLKSMDGGNSWATTGLTFNASDHQLIGRMIKHPDNDSVILAGTSKGIYRTTDYANTWTKVYSGDYIIDMEFNTENPNVIYATNNSYYERTVLLKSINNGQTWDTLHYFPNNVLRAQVAVTKADPNYIYAITANKDSGLEGIYKSTDGGESFTQIINGDDEGSALLGYYSDGSGVNEGQGEYDLCIAASPLNKEMVFIGGINTWKTMTGDTAWSIVNMWTDYDEYNLSNAPVAHADKHLLVFRNDSTLFETNDGGIYKSINNGRTWEDKTNGLVISQMYRLGVSQTNASTTLAGLQDNGTKLWIEGGWHDVTGGDGMECIIDPSDREIQYASYVNGEIYRTDNLWGDSETISENISDEDGGSWVTPYVLDSEKDSTLYVGYSDVWKTEDAGKSFFKISSFFHTDMLTVIATAPSNADYLYVADASHVWLTTDGGSEWNEVTSSLPITSGSVTNIAVKADDPNWAWVTFGSYTHKNIFETTDAGQTWTDISGLLPAVPTMCVVQNKLKTDTIQLFIGTDAGVYYKEGEADWVLYSNGIPNVVVTELEIYYDKQVASNSRLRAATYGRGLWESEIVNVGGVNPVADFRASETDVLKSETVRYTDYSQFGPTEWIWVFEGGVPDTSRIQNPNVLYDMVGVFSVSLTVSNIDGSNNLIKTDYITVNGQVPVAAFTADTLSGQAPLEVQFIDESQGANYWLWDFGNGDTSEEQNPRHIFEEGAFDIRQLVQNSYGSDTLLVEGMIVVIPSSIPETWKERLKVYPNPTDHRVTLELNGIESEVDFITLIDMRGKIIEQRNVLNDPNVNYEFNLVTLPAGTYLLRIQGEHKMVVLQLVVD